MPIEVPEYVTKFYSPRSKHGEETYHWVSCTWYPLGKYGLSRCQPGELRHFLKSRFGWTAVGILVNGELWTDESVFWQNKLVDGENYEVIYGKPYFFQLWQLFQDFWDNITWDTSVPHATPVPQGTPPKMVPIYGPSRFHEEEHLPWDCGTNWGPEDPRTQAWKDLSPMERIGPPPPYSVKNDEGDPDNRKTDEFASWQYLWAHFIEWMMDL